MNTYGGGRIKRVYCKLCLHPVVCHDVDGKCSECECGRQ